MSKLLKKTNKAAKKAKKKIKKKLPGNTITAVFTKVDNVSLRKASEISSKCRRNLKSAGPEKVDVVLKGVNRRLNNVLRTSQKALLDLASLAKDPSKTIPAAEGKSVETKLQAYKKECDQVIDNGSRILKTLKSDFPELKNQGIKQAIKVYQNQSKQINKVFKRIDTYLDLLSCLKDDDEGDEVEAEDIEEDMDED